jgi:myosin-18
MNLLVFSDTQCIIHVHYMYIISACMILFLQRRGGLVDFHTDRRGILWIMDEESVFPGASDSSFLDRVHLYHESKSSMDWGDSPLVKVIKEDNQFTLFHCQRTLPVLYDANGWVWRAREHPSFRVVVQVMAESKR